MLCLAYEFWTILIGIASLLVILYRYLTRNNDYWSKQGINGPKPIPLFGTFLDRLKANIGLLDVQYMKKYGDVYGLFDGTFPVLEIGDPNLIKEVLVKEFTRFDNRRELRTEHWILNKILFFSRSDYWKRSRTIVSSTFTTGKMKKMYGMVRTCVDDYLKYLEVVARSGQPLDIRDTNQCYTMDVIASTAFATQTNSFKDPNNPFVENVRKVFDTKASRFIPAFIFNKYFIKLLNIKSQFDPDASDYLGELLKHVIEMRRQSNQKSDDFLQLLIDAKADDSKEGDVTVGLESHYFNEDEKDTNFDNKKSYINKTLSEVEIIAMSWNFLIAGNETTATLMTLMIRELVLNPECQQKIYNEVMAAIDSQKEVSYEALHRLTYLDACISETLRLHPPVPRLEREVNQDFQLGEIKLCKGQLVEIPVYAIQRLEKYFENADQFIPERFLPENKDKIIPYTYLPFGGGPRICVGMRFALMEAKIAMAHIIMRYRFTKCHKTEEEVIFQKFGPVLSPLGLTVGIKMR